MRDRVADFNEAHIAVATFAERCYVERYRQTNDVPFLLLLDVERAAYRSYGLERATARRVWAPRVFQRYFQIFRDQGLGDLHKATEDVRQLGGDFVIDPSGTLSYARWSTGPEDRPEVDDLIEAVKRAQL